jgi:hypothetical protein
VEWDVVVGEEAAEERADGVAGEEGVRAGERKDELEGWEGEGSS